MTRRALSGQSFSVLCVLWLFAAAASAAPPFDVAITTNPPPPVQILTGQSVHFSGSWSTDDPFDNFSFSWSFGSCATPQTAAVEDPGPVTFNCGPGNHSVTFTVCAAGGGCDSAHRNIAVVSGNTAPFASIDEPAADETIYIGESLEFQSSASDPDGPAPITFDWDFPGCAVPTDSTLEDPGPVTFACADGSYNISLTVCDAALACRTVSRLVTVISNLAPVVAIDLPATDPTIAPGGTVEFASTVTDDDGPPPLEYLWTFAGCADPAQSTATDPGEVLFAACPPGAYSVELRVCDAEGACAVAARTVTVAAGTPPVAAISLPNSNVDVFSGQSVAFAGSFTDEDGVFGKFEFTWTFGACADPPASTVEDPGTVQFNCAPGPIQVRFEVCDEIGLCGDATRTVTVLSGNAPPIPSIDLPEAAVEIGVGESVVFHASASDADGPPPLSYAWDFGACATPSSSTLANPGAVTFPCPGVFSVVLEVCDFAGACNTATRQVTVVGNQPPMVSIQSPASDLSTHPGSTVGFSATATDGDGPPPLVLDWEFGDCAAPASSAAANVPSVSFAACPPGPYEIVFRACDGLDACALATRTITVLAGDAPDATILAPGSDVQISRGDAVFFAGAFEDDDSGLGAHAITWSFAPCASPPSATVEDPGLVVFDCAAGTYVVTFEVCDANDLCDLETRSITVEPSADHPVATIDLPAGPVSVSPSQPVQFAGSGVDPAGPFPLAYTWYFPACASITTSAAEDPGPVTFACPPGDYPVTFQVCDAAAFCSDTTVTVTVVAPSCQAFGPAGWSLVFADSQETTGENGAAIHAFDGNPLTLWHTRWSGSAPPAHPHEIRIDTGQVLSLCGFSYLPRQDGGTNGTIRNYEFALSLDGTNWTTVASGVLVASASDLSERHVDFPPTLGRYIRLRAQSEVNGHRWTSVAELRLRHAAGPSAVPPVVSIDQPPVSASIAAGGALTFAASATDPDGQLPLTLSWTFPSCATPSSSMLEDPGPVVFNCSDGTYTVTFQACDSGGLCAAATRQVTLGAPCVALDSSSWSVVYFDSQELVGENGAATRAIDGNPLTHWTTRWIGGSPSHPHEIRVDTGAVQTLCGFGYLPRQDGGVNGTIRNFEFAVSLDGETWVNVASGVLVSNPANLAERNVPFAPTPARYVRLRSLSEVNGGPWATMAELRLRAAGGVTSVPPIVSIDSPATNPSIPRGASLNLAATVTDPDSELPLELEWSLPACAIPSSSIVEDPGPVIFDCAIGDYPVTLEACDAAGLCASATRIVTVGGPGCLAQSNAGWSVTFFDSEELVGENGAATRAVDGNPSTHWASHWLGSAPGHPHEIRIDTGQLRTLCGFSYLPRQDGGVNGTVRNFDFAVSIDGVQWTTVASGILFTNTTALVERAVDFAPTAGRYLRFRSLSEVNGGPWITLAELSIRATDGTASLPPVAEIDLPSTDVTIPSGGRLSFAGTGTDPDEELPLSHLWTFPDCAVPSSSPVEDPGSVSFPCPPGVYGVFYEVRDAAGLTATAERQVTVGGAGCALLSQGAMSVVFADSQELAGENGAATNAIDGNPATIWHTRWTGTQPPSHPHEIRIDTGSVRNLCGFTYLPRQDGGVNGTIRDYEFSVSQNATTWVVVSGGTLVTIAGNPSEQSVAFPAISGRYVRLRALSAAGGDRFTSAAEIRIKGAP